MSEIETPILYLQSRYLIKNTRKMKRIANFTHNIISYLMAELDNSLEISIRIGHSGLQCVLSGIRYKRLELKAASPHPFGAEYLTFK